MRLNLQSSGAALAFDARQLLGRGGEGAVYQVPAHPELVAKIYHPGKAPPLRKLELMLANAPLDAAAAGGHSSIAWPVDILLDPHAVHLPAGFVMKRVSGYHELHEVYDPSDRVREVPAFTYQHLIRTAANLASAMRAIHKSGYVAGDLNEQNVGVTETALVTLFDTDSFQVSDPGRGQVFRCTVARPGFAAPELIRAGSFDSTDRTPAHDHFALAVLFFKLLMEGAHPFDGVYTGAGDVPDYDVRIEAGHFVYSPSNRAPYQRSPRPPPFEMLAPELRRLFVMCFDEGHAHPKARPDALTWHQALSTAEASLRRCAVNASHRYFPHVPACPWCVRLAARGYDPFPSVESIRRGTHLPVSKPKPPVQRRPAPQPQGTAPTPWSPRPGKAAPVQRRIIQAGGYRGSTGSPARRATAKAKGVGWSFFILWVVFRVLTSSDLWRSSPSPRTGWSTPSYFQQLPSLPPSLTGSSGMAVDRTESSPKNDLRIEYRSGNGGSRREIWLTSAKGAFPDQMLAPYAKIASVKFSPDEKWLVINRPELTDTTAVELLAAKTDGQFEHVPGMESGKPQLGRRAWNFFLETTGRSPDSPRDEVSIAAHNWDKYSQAVSLQIENTALSINASVPGFWCCRYDPSSNTFTAVSPRSDFSVAAAPRVDFNASHYFSDQAEVGKFINEHLGKENRRDLVEIMNDYADNGDFSDKRPRTKEDVEKELIGYYFQWPRSREEFIKPLELAPTGAHRWSVVCVTRYRKESDATRNAMEGERKRRMTIVEENGKYSIVREDSFAYGEHVAVGPSSTRFAKPPSVSAPGGTVNPRATRP